MLLPLNEDYFALDAARNSEVSLLYAQQIQDLAEMNIILSQPFSLKQYLVEGFLTLE